MDEYWTEALNEISDEHLEEAIHPRRKRKFPWFGAAAASLAAVMLIVLISPLVLIAMVFGGGGMGAAADPGGAATPTRSPADWFDSLPQAGLLSAPEYPEMVPYPNHDPDGRYGADGAADQQRWRDSLRAQYNQPNDYEAGLDDFFARSIPLFLGDSDKNAVCSPLNIYMALAMLAETTGGESRSSILTALNADSMESLRTQAGHVWNAHYRADGAASCLLANSLWLNEGYAFNRETVDTLADSYYASVYQGKLGSGEMNDSLRNWLSVQTQGLLDEYIHNVEMSDQDALALASTVYYSARWVDEFNPDKNTEGLFHSPDGDVNATFMNRTTDYGLYYYGEDFGAVNLKVGKSSYDYTMWLILPDEGCDPGDILESGHALSIILGVEEEQYKELKIHLSLPKFDISAETDLRGGMTALGLGDLFSETDADFSGILQDHRGAHLDKVSHAARVAIDEEGVTAAAYTLMTYYGAAAPMEDEIYFTLDRPFLFVITSHDNLPLFVGVVNEP